MARTVADMTPDEFSDAIANGFSRVNGMTRGTPAPSSSGASVGMPGWINTIGNGMNNAASSASKMATGMYGVSDALGNIKQLGGFFGPLGTMVSTMGTQVAEGGIAVNRSLNQVAQNGIHLGQNLGLYDKAVLAARMSLPEFEQQIRKNSSSLAGLGANMDKSALSYLAVAKNIQDTDIAYQLKATGMQSEEFGEILSLVANNQKKFDITNAGVQQRMMATTLALATEFDNTARLTGISRQEQQKSLEKQLKSTDLQLAMAALSQEQQEVLTQNIASGAKYGETFQNALRIYATGGVTTAARQQEILKLGPLAKYAEEMANLQGTPEQIAKGRKAIELQMQEELAAGTKNAEQLKTMSVLAEAGSETTRAMAKGELERYQLGLIYAKAEKEAQERGISREKYISEELAKLQKEREGAAAGTGGPEGEAAKLGQTLNKVDILFKDVAAGAGTYFSKLNDKVGETITGLGNLNTVLRRYTPEQLAGLPQAAVDAAKAKTGVKEAKIPEKEKGRADGSLGAVGKLIEDFGAGTEMMLHGKEGVITEKQLRDIISTASTIGKKQFTDIEKIALTGGATTQEKANQLAKAGAPDLTSIQKQFEPLFKQFDKTAQSIVQKTSASITPVISNMQSGLKTDLEKAKLMMPTTSTFEKIFEKVKPTEAPVTSPKSDDFINFNNQDQEGDAMSEVVKGVNELNKRIERLITVVEDGNNKSVKAIKNTSNLIA